MRWPLRALLAGVLLALPGAHAWPTVASACRCVVPRQVVSPTPQAPWPVDAAFVYLGRSQAVPALSAIEDGLELAVDWQVLGRQDPADICQPELLIGQPVEPLQQGQRYVLGGGSDGLEFVAGPPLGPAELPAPLSLSWEPNHRPARDRNSASCDWGRGASELDLVVAVDGLSESEVPLLVHVEAFDACGRRAEQRARLVQSGGGVDLSFPLDERAVGCLAVTVRDRFGRPVFDEAACPPPDYDAGSEAPAQGCPQDAGLDADTAPEPHDAGAGPVMNPAGDAGGTVTQDASAGAAPDGTGGVMVGPEPEPEPEPRYANYCFCTLPGLQSRGGAPPLSGLLFMCLLARLARRRH